MADVVEFDGETTLNVPVQRILSHAVDAGLTRAIVVGYEENGDFYFSASEGDIAKVHLDLHRAAQLALDEVMSDG